MKIFYIYPEEIPSKKARSVSAINTAFELSKIADCSLYIAQESSLKKQEICSFYNIPNLDLFKISFIAKTLLGLKSNHFFHYRLKDLLHQNPSCIFYVRHLKVAQYLLKNKQPNQKVIFECHEIFYKTLKEEQPRQYRKIATLKHIESFIYEKCDGLVFSNRTLQQYVNETFLTIQNQQTVIYNGMKYSSPYIKKDFSSIKEIFYVGNFFKWKGVEDAIHALKFLPNLTLNLIGGDSENRIKELTHLIHLLALENSVTFLGYKSSEKVQTILEQNAKLTIIPNTSSIQNNFSMPIKLFEYMATSNIVIAANTKTIKEIIIDGINGFLFECGSVDSLVKTIEKVLNTDSKILQRISKNAFDTIQKFSWHNRAYQILDFCIKISK